MTKLTMSDFGLSAQHDMHTIICVVANNRDKDAIYYRWAADALWYYVHTCRATGAEHLAFRSAKGENAFRLIELAASYLMSGVDQYDAASRAFDRWMPHQKIA